MILRGRVQSGVGDFAYWLEKLEPFYIGKAGMKLFPGTLNVHLVDQTYELPLDCLQLDKDEYGGTVTVRIGECKVFGRKAFILRPGGHKGDSVLEIASDIKLRDAYKLQDGDIIEVEVPDP